jgi:hypothetical protein
LALIVVTRLRLRDAQVVDEFFAAAIAVVEQAQSSEGNLAADVLADADNTYWTRTSWTAQKTMRQFMVTEPHRTTMDRIDDWCDEATYVAWEQPEATLPDWAVAHARLIAQGQVVTLAHASPDNAGRTFPKPTV